MRITDIAPHVLSGNGNSLLEFRMLRSVEDMASVEPDWRSLEETASRPNNLFQTFNWCWNCCASIESDPESSWSIRILTGWKHDKLVLVWPMALTGPNPLGVHEARWLGEPLTQYGDIIVADDPARDTWIMEAWKVFLAQPDIDLLILRKVRKDAVIASFLNEQAYNLPGLQEAPAINLKQYANWEELDATSKRNHRKNRARHRRRFKEIGTLSFELFDNGINAQQAIAQALDFKKAWLKKYSYSSSICNEVNANLLSAMARGGKKPVECLASVIYLDTEPVAIEVGFGWKKHYYAHIGAYNPWFAKFGPGKILMEEEISTLMDRGYETYDQLAPADSYKREWETNLVDVRDHALPVNLRGMTHMGFYLKLIRPGMKNVYEQMPKPIRQRLNRFAESA